MTSTAQDRPRFSASQLAWAVVRAVSVVLVLFHVWLLVRRWGDGMLLQPEVAVRWLLTLALGLGWWLAHRRGSGPSGRRSLAFVALVMLLHSGLPMPMTSLGVMLGALPLAAIGGLLLPLPLTLKLTLTVATWVLDSLASTDLQAETASVWQSVADVTTFAAIAVLYPPSFCRPPPA